MINLLRRFVADWPFEVEASWPEISRTRDAKEETVPSCRYSNRCTKGSFSKISTLPSSSDPILRYYLHFAASPPGNSLS